MCIYTDIKEVNIIDGETTNWKTMYRMKIFCKTVCVCGCTHWKRSRNVHSKGLILIKFGQWKKMWLSS